jgi:hypothetical protein
MSSIIAPEGNSWTVCFTLNLVRSSTTELLVKSTFIKPVASQKDYSQNYCFSNSFSDHANGLENVVFKAVGVMGFSNG